MEFAPDPVLQIVRQLCGACCFSKVSHPCFIELVSVEPNTGPNSHLLLAYRAAHVGMLSIVAPINVLALLAAVHVCVPLDPLADLKRSLAVGLRAEVHCSALRQRTAKR